MDLNNYWQENKRFLTIVGLCVVAFFIAWAVIDGSLGDSLRAQNARLARVKRDLQKPMFDNNDLGAATRENDALRSAVADLARAVEFEPRPEFALLPGSAPSSRYFAVVSDVRDDLTSRAGRAGLSLPKDLGLPALSPTREQEIARFLEGLDIVESVVRLAIEVGCERIDRIQIQLDARLLSGKAIAGLEKTVVEFRFTGPSEPLVRLLQLLQREQGGRTIQVERAEVQPSRSRQDQVRLDVELVAAHLHGLAEGGADSAERGEAIE